MTYYPGSKKRIGKEIAETIVDHVLQEVDNGFKLKGYCEPFCGMLGVYRHIPELIQEEGFKNLKYIASDRNPYIIKLWKGLQNGWIPPSTCSENEFYSFKQTKNKSLKSIFVRYAGSFLGRFNSSFASANNIKSQKDACVSISKSLKTVSFNTHDYHNLSNISGYVIYCDPPYKHTQHLYTVGETYDTVFDSDEFFEWCKYMSRYNIVFISEYTKPCKEAKLIWNNGKEKLFVL